MARILCVNPWIIDFTAYNQWIEPLGLLSVAGALRAVGHDITLLDCLDRFHPDALAPRAPEDRFGCGHFSKVEVTKPAVLSHVRRRYGRYGLPVGLVERELLQMRRPDAVLVTCMMTYWYPGAFEAIQLVRGLWPGVPVALGGVYANLCCDHARLHSGADAVLTGPGEDSARRWVESITGDPGNRSSPRENPRPAHDLRRAQGYVALLTGRGCPFHCPYCAAQVLNPGGFAPRSVEEVVDEITWCVEGLGVADIAFYDDALLIDAESHISPILNAVIRRGLRVRFHTPNGLHARFVDDRLAVQMRRAGFVTMRLGLETADDRLSLEDGNKVDCDEFGRAVRSLKAAGFTVRDLAAYVLVGRPPRFGQTAGSDLDAVRRTVAFAHRQGVQVRAAEFSPVPGTLEWQRAVSRGCIASDADPLLHNKALYPCGERNAIEQLKREIRDGNRALLRREE